MIKRISNPPNPYAEYTADWLDVPPAAELEVFEEQAKSIIAENNSPDIGFRYSVNPYRGCFHSCAYCYARPTHQYLDFGAGSDFDRKIVAKINAPELLRKAFMKPSWTGDLIIFSGVTDCYQPLEGSYRLTQQCLEVCCEFRNPVSIITKGLLIRRDIDLLQRLAKIASVYVHISIAFADDEMAKKLEPHAPRPSRRFQAMKELSDAGIPVGVGIAPIIPGLTEEQIPEILQRAKEAGACSAFHTLLRLPAEVKDVFFERLELAFPNRVQKVKQRLLGLKEGKLNRSEFGKRFSGNGPQWEAIEWLFQHTAEQLGLSSLHRKDSKDIQPSIPRNTFRRPTNQLSLF